MVIRTHRKAKCAITTWLALILCMLCQRALSQEYTAKDSAAFRKALEESHSDAERINYELKLADYYIKKPGSFKLDLDNARDCINISKQLNAKLRSKEADGHILLEEGCLLRENGISQQSTDLVLRAISLLQNCSDKCLLAGAYRDLSNCYNANDQLQQEPRIEALKKSIAYYKQCGNKLKTAVVLGQLAEMYEITNNYNLGISTVNEAIALNNSIHYPQVQGQYCILGDVYYDLSDFYNAVKCYLKSLKVSNSLKDSTMQYCETNNHLALALVGLGQVNNAIPYYKTALLIAQKHGDFGSVSYIAKNIAQCYLKLKQPKAALQIFDGIMKPFEHTAINDHQKLSIDNIYLTIFLGLNQYDNARMYAEKIMHLVDAPSVDKSDRFSSYNALILYYFSIKDYNKELQCLLINQQIAGQSGKPVYKVTNLEAWYKMDSAKNDYNAAFVHLSQYKTLADSIFNEKKSQQIAQLQTEYETQQKENEIRLNSKDIKLLTQNAKLDQAHLKSARIIRNVTFAAIIIAILISVMQYRRYHEKQKLNLLITKKNTQLQTLVNEKEWLLKEVHHRVKNNLHTVICLLESQAAFLENDALKAVESSQHRIFAMSLVHQRLYQSTDLQTVDIASYLSELIVYLKESFGSPANIVFQQAIECVRLDVSQAIPLALIVNEAVTNSIKYAFPAKMHGYIKVTLSLEKETVKLLIEDNGIGMPENVQNGKLSSLGLELIKGLTDDLKGSVKFIVNKGTSISVSFNKAPFTNIM